MRETLIDYLDSNSMPEYYISEQFSDIELTKIVETHKYIKRREDGQKYSNMMGAELVLSPYTDDIKKELDLFFKTSQEFLCQGWWKSALRDLLDKTPTGNVSQQVYDEVVNYITNYIVESYK